MTIIIFPSLQHIATRQLQKNLLVRPDPPYFRTYRAHPLIPPRFLDFVKETWFISRNDIYELVLGELLLAKKIQFHLGIPSILAGAFCAYQMGKTNFCDKLQIVVLVKNVKEMAKRRDVVANSLQGDLIQIEKVNTSQTWITHMDLECTDGHFSVQLQFLTIYDRQQLSNLRQTPLKFADKAINGMFYHESEKCVGFSLQDGGYFFCALGQMEFYSFSDLKLLGTAPFPMLNGWDAVCPKMGLAVNERSEAIDSELETRGLQDPAHRIRNWIRWQHDHVRCLMNGHFPVKNEKILETFVDQKK